MNEKNDSLFNYIKNLCESDLNLVIHFVLGMISINEQLPDKSSCPYCGSSHVIKYGHKDGKQHFLGGLRKVKKRLQILKRCCIQYFSLVGSDKRTERKIKQIAQALLDARALYLDSLLANLYDELTMPPELRKAHMQNDKVVMQAYGFSIKDTTEESCVAELMNRYQHLIMI